MDFRMDVNSLLCALFRTSLAIRLIFDNIFSRSGGILPSMTDRASFIEVL